MYFCRSFADPEAPYLHLTIGNCCTNYIIDVASVSLFMEAGFGKLASNGIQAEPKCGEIYTQTICQYVLILHCICKLTLRNSELGVIRN